MVQSISIHFTGLPLAETEQTPTPISAVPTEATTAHEEVQPSNPILPTAPEFVWGAVMFTLLWVLMKFVLLKPIQKTMADRADQVRGDVAGAEESRASALAALAEYEASLASARVEAGRIIDDGRAQAEAKRKETIAAAEAEVAELRAAANTEVTEAKSVAMASMRSSVATIAVQAAEAVVQKRLDENAMRSIIDDYLNRVGSQN